MTLAEMMRLALRQLDEDPADISEFSDLFRQYANEGYSIAVRRYYKPKDTLTLRTDAEGEAYIGEQGIVQLVSLTDEYGRHIPYTLSPDGTSIKTDARDAHLTAVAEIEPDAMQDDGDTPILPEHTHMALVDYICYRYLMNGNAAKQGRASAYYGQFTRTMNEIRPQGSGSVTRFRNLYAVSDIRRRG